MSRLELRRKRTLEMTGRKYSLPTMVQWESSKESVRIVCQTSMETNASFDSSRDEDICLHKPVVHNSNEDEVEERNETAV